MNEIYNTEGGHAADVRGISSVIRKVRDGLGNVVKSDVELAKSEMQETTGLLKTDGMNTAVFGAVAALGILPFIAFLVIGLGRVLNDNFWLSSLIVALVLTVGGGLIAFASLKRLRSHDMTFPHTRRAVGQEISTVKRKVSQISEKTKGRVA